MNRIIIGRILVAITFIFSSISFGYLFFTEFVDYPIVYIFTIPMCGYFPVVTGILFIMTLGIDINDPNNDGGIINVS